MNSTDCSLSSSLCSSSSGLLSPIISGGPSIENAMINDFVNLNPKYGQWPLKPNSSFKTTPSVIIGLFVHRNTIIVVKMNGDVFIVDSDLTTMHDLTRFTTPSYLAPKKPYEYAEFDAHSATIFLTTASHDGIFMSSELVAQDVNFVKFFVANKDPDREFWGLSIDHDRQLLYCCNRKGRGSIGAWRLSDATLIIECSIVDGWPFTFLQCCSVSANHGAIAVSSSPSQKVMLFDCSGLHRFLPLTIAAKTTKRRGDPTKFIANPLGMVFDMFGNLLIADCGNSKLQIYTPKCDGDLRTLASTWTSDKLISSPRCVNIAVLNGVQTVFAGLHNGNLVCFKKQVP